MLLAAVLSIMVAGFVFTTGRMFVNPIFLLRAVSCFVVALWVNAAAAQTHHQLTVTLDPESHRIEVEDRITLTDSADANVAMLLHAGLKPELIDADGATLSVTAAAPAGPVPLQRLNVSLASGKKTVTLSFGGDIHHPLGPSGTPGLIAPEGVFLAGSSYWVPRLAEQLVTFELTVALPAGWRSISQGQRHQEANTDTWSIDKPQQEIYLIAAEFTEYSERSDASGVEARVLLRQPNPDLAQKYLDATLYWTVQRTNWPISLQPICPGREFLANRLRHAVVYPAGLKGDPAAVYYLFVVSARDFAQLVG